MKRGRKMLVCLLNRAGELRGQVDRARRGGGECTIFRKWPMTPERYAEIADHLREAEDGTPLKDYEDPETLCFELFEALTEAMQPHSAEIVTVHMGGAEA